MIENLLFLEDEIKAALREHLDPAVYVLSAADLAGVAESDQPTPAVHVLYRDYRVTDSAVGSHAGIEQQWLTVVVTRHLGDLTGGSAARGAAGLLARTVIDCLHGRRFPGAKPLRLAPAPAAGFSAGHFYLPLGWTAGLNLRSSTCESN